MKLKAIRFPKEVSDEMVRAILDGRKSVTRRVWVIEFERISKEEALNNE